jgi:hypothetical protein
MFAVAEAEAPPVRDEASCWSLAGALYQPAETKRYETGVS